MSYLWCVRLSSCVLGVVCKVVVLCPRYCVVSIGRRNTRWRWSFRVTLLESSGMTLLELSLLYWDVSERGTGEERERGKERNREGRMEGVMNGGKD